ncbi:MAG: hypothetical protein Q8K59_05120 [Nitrosomonas sp.]|nr:hypothetical protein [Nitrosomonas sp.]MDP1950466.1 hypothetical protein [Nitrosomonas sp.]
MKKTIHQIINKRHIPRLVSQIQTSIDSLIGQIPILIVSFNNGVYVDHCVRQLNARLIKPIIIDNASNDLETLDLLSDIALSGNALVVRSTRNMGARIGFQGPVYDILPDTFGYTDPDLLFNQHLPEDFIEQLCDICDQFKCFKAGFALPYLVQHALTDKCLKPRLGSIVPYKKLMNVSEWESRFWTKPLQHDRLELYAAPIDTTFAIYRKKNFNGDFFDSVRVAGDFSALHMPWFPDLDLFSPEHKAAYLKGNNSSTWVTS